MLDIAKMSPTEKFLFVTTAIENALQTPEILTAITAFGYDATKLAEAKTLLTEAEALHKLKEVEYSEKYEQSAAKKNARLQAEKTYSVMVKLARIAFKDSPARIRQLGISGKRATSLEGLIQEATQFYNIALSNPDILQKLGQLGINTAKLEAGKTEITALQTIHATQQQAKGKAETSTEVRDVKIKELDRWMGDFIKVTRIALADTPQWLVALGLKM